MENYTEKNVVSNGDHINQEIGPTKKEIQDVWGEDITNLMVEVVKDNKENVELLLNQGEDVNALAKTGSCALIMAAATNTTTDISELLLDKGANINNNCLAGWSPLMHASAEMKLSFIELFVARNADINHAGNDNETSIMISSSLGSKKIVQLLMSKGANINTIDRFGSTSIMEATQGGHTEVVEVLEKWCFTMLIIVLEELHCYELLVDMSYLIDFIEFLGNESDYI
jgi:ankyrin repeat protein